MKALAITTQPDGAARVFAGAGYGFYLEPVSGAWPASVIVDDQEQAPVELHRARSLYYGQPFRTLDLRGGGNAKTWRAFVFEHPRDGLADGSAAAAGEGVAGNLEIIASFELQAHVNEARHYGANGYQATEAAVVPWDVRAYSYVQIMELLVFAAGATSATPTAWAHGLRHTLDGSAGGALFVADDHTPYLSFAEKLRVSAYGGSVTPSGRNRAWRPTWLRYAKSGQLVANNATAVPLHVRIYGAR